MTSKEKLIEFLKSAKIEYDTYSDTKGYWVEIEYTCWLFDTEGKYLLQENY